MVSGYRCRLMVAIDGVNGFWRESALRDELYKSVSLLYGYLPWPRVLGHFLSCGESIFCIIMGVESLFA